MIRLALLFAAALGDGEADYYAVDYLTPPDGELLEVGGLDFLPDGRLAVSTRRGQVWLVENPLAADPTEARFTLFAEGLWEGLGLTVVDGDIYVVQRGELSRLRDVDADGRCDDIETLCDDWGISGNYHEFAYGLPIDRQGNFYVSLNVSFFNPNWWHGKSPVPYRGWVLRIDPTGAIEPLASGLRSPCGLGWSAENELLVTDNQGDWMPASPLFVIREGGFFGHPASLDWTPPYRESQTFASDTIPPARASSDRDPAAIWLPYEWSRSPGNVVVDHSQGKFGPFEKQLFIAELTNGMLLRGDLETVNGVRQGWVIPFRRHVGSSVRLRFAPDGTLFAGFTNRGWGGLSPADGIGRLRWTGVTPFEIADVELLLGGFRVSFTAPVAEGQGGARITQYDYDYWWEYGSPERARENVPVNALIWAQDRRSVYLSTPELVAAKVARVVFEDVVSADGEPLLHREFAYTVNQLVGGEPTREHVAKVVPPPPTRKQQNKGWLRLTYGDATDAWDSTGWELCDAELDPDERTRFVTSPGVNALTNTASESPSDYLSRYAFGDGTFELNFMLPEGGSASVWIHGRYGIRLDDTPDHTSIGSEHCGALMEGPGFPAREPLAHAYRGPGEWHKLRVEFRGPRFDAEGRKLANAVLERVAIDDITLHEDVELNGSPGEETAEGRLVLRAASHFGVGSIRFKGSGEMTESSDWVPLLADTEDLAPWQASGGAFWEMDDGVLIGEGPRGFLFSPRDDYRDFELRARVKISDGGNASLFLRASPDAAGPTGYAAQINSSFAAPDKTGSLAGLSPVKVQLVEADTWLDYHLTCLDAPGGTRILIRVNGVLVTDYLDEERRHSSGHIAFEQHHEGSVVEISDLAIREL